MLWATLCVAVHTLAVLHLRCQRTGVPLVRMYALLLAYAACTSTVVATWPYPNTSLAAAYLYLVYIFRTDKHVRVRL